LKIIQDLFLAVHQWMQGSLLVAVSGALLWGIFSVILSPCHLAAIPLIIGYIASKQGQDAKKAFITSFIFSMGILVSIVLIGFITISMRRIAGDVGPLGNYLVGAILIFFGLNLTGLFSLGQCGPGAKLSSKNLKSGHGGTFLFGILLGIGLGPCTFAFMAPLLGIVFQTAATHLLKAILIMVFFAIGHVGVIIFAGTSTGSVQKYLNWAEDSKAIKYVKLVCGILVIIAGIYMLSKELLPLIK